MKKALLIMICLLAAIFAVTAVASAASSKEGYYNEISGLLSNIRTALDNGDTAAAQTALGQLRSKVYECASFLIKINSYDIRILNVAAQAEEALRSSDYADKLSAADALAYEILIGKTPEPVVDIPQHS